MCLFVCGRECLPNRSVYSRQVPPLSSLLLWLYPHSHALVCHYGWRIDLSQATNAHDAVAATSNWLGPLGPCAAHGLHCPTLHPRPSPLSILVGRTVRCLWYRCHVCGANAVGIMETTRMRRLPLLCVEWFITITICEALARVSTYDNILCMLRIWWFCVCVRCSALCWADMCLCMTVNDLPWWCSCFIYVYKYIYVYI
jgi:hypothetical protein